MTPSPLRFWHARSVCFAAAAALLLTLLAPVPRAEAVHGFCALDVINSDEKSSAGTDDPGNEVDNHQVGEAHTMTARLIAQDPAFSCFASTAIVIHWENEAGANDPDNSVSRSTPDFACTIPAGSSTTASCSVGYTGFNTGTDIIRAWINHDNASSDFEGDPAEGRNEATQPGTGDVNCGSVGATEPEPDCTDVVQANWGAPFASLDCDDSNGPDTEHEFNPSGAGSASEEVYVCYTRTSTGSPFEPSGSTDQFVYGEVENGVNDPDPDDQENSPSYQSPDYSCTIESDSSSANFGSCTINVRQLEGELGTAEICFYTSTSDDPAEVDQAGIRNCQPSPTSNGEETEEAQRPDGTDPGNDFADQVELTWIEATGTGVDAEPEAEANATNELHVITAYVFDQFERPSTGNHIVNVEFFAQSVSDTDGNSPTSPDSFCNTNGTDRCEIRYTSATQGLDVMCVWLNMPPSMTGDARNAPQCDAEGPNDPDDDPNVADAPAPNDDQDVIQKIWQSPQAASRIDCDPETDTNPIGTSHQVTCTASTSGGLPQSGVSIDVEASGANDPDGGITPFSPDFSCVTGPDGRCAVTHGPGGQGTTDDAGTTTYRGWIDADNSNATVEADVGEGRDEAAAAGTRGEPDETDLVEKTWTTATPTPTQTATATPTQTNTTRPPTQTACPGCQFGRSVTLTATKNRVLYRSQFTLTGTVSAEQGAPASCTSGVPVQILRDELGDSEQSFTQVGSATTGSSGAFAVNFRGDKNAIYVATVNANTPAGCDEATSDPESVLVRVRVILKTSRRAVRPGGRVRLNARVAPCADHANDKIVLFASRGARLGRVAKKRSDGSCRAVFKRRVQKRTVFQARWPRQDNDHLLGRSRRKTVRMKR